MPNPKPKPSRKRAAKVQEPSEAEVMKTCMALLAFWRFFHWRNNSGSLRDATGRPVRFGKVGSADILAVVPRSGRLLAVETKKRGGKLTDHQREFLMKVEASGGVAVVICEPVKLEEILQTLAVDPWCEVRSEWKAAS